MNRLCSRRSSQALHLRYLLTRQPLIRRCYCKYRVPVKFLDVMGSQTMAHIRFGSVDDGGAMPIPHGGRNMMTYTANQQFSPREAAFLKAHSRQLLHKSERGALAGSVGIPSTAGYCRYSKHSLPTLKNRRRFAPD